MSQTLKRGQDLAARHGDRATNYLGGKGFAEHERRLFACYLAPGFDPSDTTEPLPNVVEILPTPRITNKPLDTVVQKESGGMEAVRVQRFYVQGISRSYLDDDVRPDFWLVVDWQALLVDDAPVDPAAADVRSKKYPRYILLGTPEPFQNEYQLTLVETRG